MFQTPHTPQSFSTNVSQLLEFQARELEDWRSSMMTMEVLLAELNTDRAAKAEEIQRLKVHLQGVQSASLVPPRAPPNLNNTKRRNILCCFKLEKGENCYKFFKKKFQAQLNEKEITCIEIQTLLDKFYKMQGLPHPTPADNG